MIPTYRYNQLVEHELFGIGQLIGYNSSTGKYLVEYGHEPTFTRWCDAETLIEHNAVEKEGQTSLEAFV